MGRVTPVVSESYCRNAPLLGEPGIGRIVGGVDEEDRRAASRSGWIMWKRGGAAEGE